MNQLVKKYVGNYQFMNSFSITNLKYWSNCEEIVYETLNLLNDLSIGYSAVKKLVALQETSFLLNNHTVASI